MADEILHGAAAIASALGLPVRSVYHHGAAGRLPVFKLGTTVCARRSAVTAWLARCDVNRH